MPLAKRKTKKSSKASSKKSSQSGTGKVSIGQNTIQAKKVEVKTGIKLSSSHVVNLKNPFEEKFDNNRHDFFNSSTIKPQPVKTSIPPRPTRLNYSPNKNKLAVNFLSAGSKFFNQSWFKSFLGPKKIDQKNQPSPSPLITFQPTDDNQESIMEDIFAPPNHVEFLSLVIPKDWPKKISIFLMMSLIFVLPLQALSYYQDLQDTKDRILLATNEAIENLKKGEQAAINLNLAGADYEFDQAKLNFNLAQREVENLNSLATEIVKIFPGKGQSVNAGINLLAAGQIAAETGQILINSGQRFMSATGIENYYESLVAFESDLRIVIDKFNEAKQKIVSVDPADLPAENRQDFEKVLKDLDKIELSLKTVLTIDKSALKMLGQNQWQRYLVIFLNNNELRATGGFMGSYALVDVDRGQIKKINIPGGGTYDLQGSLIPKVAAPEPLRLINARWEFQDSNWWPDFPTAAKKIQWFHENSSQPSVDGVIVLTSTLMERLLGIFGPIEMPEYGRTITSENFVLETQKIVELEYDKEENRPKQFIADLAPMLLEKIFSANQQQFEQLFGLFKDALNQRQLQAYFNDYQIETLLRQFGWSGELRQTDGDYLSVVHTNLAGGKSDGVIDQTIQHQAEIKADGTIIDTVKLIRRHQGTKGQDIFTGVQNNSYVRFYVPPGSVLLAAEGFQKPPAELFDQPDPELKPDTDLLSIETDRQFDQQTGTDIYRENGKTVFGNWLQLKPGEVQQATIRYRLPFKLALEGENIFYYSLLVQKQAGSLNNQLISNLILDNHFKPLAKFPADLSSSDNEVNFTSNLITDKFYGVTLIAN
ncbi:MAG: DUF4012 domain-containing protein [Patescibacteria group bacterium]|jgi:hypothetical protein|nr:DUF4012 domain-containing protein [Patescibacteria group bacterium]